MNEKLLLQDLVVLLAKKSGITQKEADKFFRELFQLVLEGIYGNDIVKIKDFGTFKLVKINSRESVDVNTGNKIEIPAHYKMSFTPDKTLKELVNEPFAHFESVPLDEDERAVKENEESVKTSKERVLEMPKPAQVEGVKEPILEDDEEDEDELLEMESDIEDESATDTQSGGLLDDFSFLSEEPKAPVADTDRKGEKQPETKQPEEKSTPEKETVSQEEKPKRKIDLIDLIDVNSLPKRTIKVEEKKEKTSAPPLLDLIDVKREKKVVETKVTKADTDIEKKLPEKTSTPEKVIIPEKKNIVEETIISEKVTTDKIVFEDVNINRGTEENVNKEKVAAERNIPTEKPVVPEKVVVPERNVASERKEPKEEKIKGGIPLNIPTVVSASKQSEPVKRETVKTANGASYVPEHFDDDADDFDYGYVDYEKLAQESKWKRRLPIIIAAVVVLLFAIYQFAKLFDVTYDYEYYINHVPPLSLSDSLPMVDEQPTGATPASVAKDSLTSAVKDNGGGATGVNPHTNERIGANIDELTRRLKAENGVERKSIDISERLQIKVTNKAEVFLSQK